MDYRIKWLLGNGSILAMFLIGINYHISGLLQLSIMMYWLISLIGLLFFSDKLCDDFATKFGDKKRTPLWLNAVYDSSIVLMLAYFGYPILAFLHALHIFAHSNLCNRFNKPVDKESDKEK